MNERDIELARQAGLEFTYDPTETPMSVFVEARGEDLETFADLIRADEREACAQVCESHVRHPSRLHFAEAIRARGNT